MDFRLPPENPLTLVMGSVNEYIEPAAGAGVNKFQKFNKIKRKENVLCITMVNWFLKS